ncbi:MAG: class F sortase [Chloroflexota bacterium]
MSMRDSSVPSQATVTKQSDIRTTEYMFSRVDLPMRYLITSLIGILLLVGCGSSAPMAEPNPTPIGTIAPQNTPTPDMVVMTTDPLAPSQAFPPVLLEIPAIGLMATVTAMEWEIADVEGQRTTVWRVPEDSAGWHIDSAGVGAKGNIILSGHQQSGSAVFKPVALGSVTQGQKILLTNEAGDIFIYEVTQVSQPIPLEGTSAEQLEEANQYYASSSKPVLTLITGWPDFTTTHRIFVVAQFIGRSG